jgi:uncharacterized protein (DUF305 family)
MSTSTEAGSAAAPAAEPRNGSEPRPRPRYAAGWLIGALALGLLVGLSGAYIALQPRTPGDTSPEAGFLRDMSTHHAQAVEMSMIAHANSTDPEIVTLSGDIALTQQAQIGYMQAWLRDWNLSPTGSQPVMAWMPDSAGAVVNGLMPGMATPDQLAALRKATGKNLDVMFLTLMRQHHLGGIHMAQEILTLSKNTDVTWLAQNMVSNQQGELTVIDGLLKQLGATS